MKLLDRYIFFRFLTNFVILFALMFLFAITIDLVLALDKFVDVARELVRAETEEASSFKVFIALIQLAVNFEAPRFFQFFAFLHGMVAIGAMGFTLAQLYRNRELVAMLSAGIGMKRIVIPFIVGSFGLSMLQLVNQEFLLPRVAPLLLRGHGDIGQQTVESFPIRFTRDREGALLQAAAFDPRSGELEAPTILVRDASGRTTQRITAEHARWVARDIDGVSTEGWGLENGQSIALSADGRRRPRSDIDFFATDLSPRVLTVLRHGEYAGMLSLRQIQRVLDTPGIVRQEQVLRSLKRHKYSRFAAVLVNVLVMWLALPSFLLREPANLMIRSIECSGVAIVALIGSAIFMVTDLPGIPPAVGVFMPVLIMAPIAIGRWMYVRT